MKTTQCERNLTIPRPALLGLVALMGLSIPKWPSIASGFSGLQSWMVERLAEWDTWRPSRRDYVLVTAWPSPPRFRARTTATGLDAPDVESKARSRQFEARDWIATAGDASVEMRLALELRRSAG